MGDVVMRAFLLLTLCVAACALPSADEVVPETQLFVSDDEKASSFDEAREMVSSMTAAGKTDKDCRKLATESKKEVKKTVEQAQKILDALSTGAECNKAHDSTVGKAQTLKDKADQKAADAKKAVDKSCDVKVDFGSFHLSSLKPGKCDQFYSKSAYTSAAKKCADAKKAKEKADGAKDEATKSLAKTKKAAGRDKLKCLCAVKYEHIRAWNNAQKSNDANKKSWARAHHIECVLDATPASKCTVPATPAVKKPTIISAAKNAQCNQVRQIAMTVNGGSSLLKYNSKYWTDSTIGDLGSGNSKTDLFLEKMDSVFITFNGGYTVQLSLGGKSLQEVFKGGYMKTSLSVSNFASFGKNYGMQPHCNKQGFDVSVGGKKARFGLIMNNENDCRTPDSMIGAGLSTGPAAGGQCGCCANRGSCRNQAATVTFAVSGALGYYGKK